MNAWLRAMDMPYLLVATKADKISRGQYSRQAKIIRQDLGGVEPILFSAQTRQGREQVWKAVFSLCKKNKEICPRGGSGFGGNRACRRVIIY